MNIERQIIFDAVICARFRPEFFDQVSGGDFEHDETIMMFQILEDMEGNNESITASQFLFRLTAAKIKTAELMEPLTETVDSLANCAAHLKIFREQVNQAKIKATINQAVIQLKKGVRSDEVMLRISENIDGITSRVKCETKSFKDGAVEYYQEKAEMRASGKKTAGHETGFEYIDNMMGGLIPGHLTILAARTSVGKTVTACQMAAHMVSKGIPVLYFSMEMNEREIKDRIVSMLLDINHDALKRATLNDAELTRIGNFINDFNHPFFINYIRGASLLNIKHELRKMAIKGIKIGSLIVDHLQYMRLPRAEKKTDAIGLVTKGLLEMAGENSLNSLLLCQLNREIEKSGGPRSKQRRPILSDLRDSGEIENDAHDVIFLHRQVVGDDKKTAEMIIAKNRGGQCGYKALEFDGNHVRFREVESVSAPEARTDKKRYEPD